MVINVGIIIKSGDSGNIGTNIITMVIVLILLEMMIDDDDGDVDNDGNNDEDEDGYGNDGYYSYYNRNTSISNIIIIVT